MDQEREDYRDKPEPEGRDLLPLLWLAVSPLLFFMLTAAGAVAWVMVRDGRQLAPTRPAGHTAGGVP